jgi:thioredoxin 1
MKKWYRLSVILILLLIVAVVIIKKNTKTKPITKTSPPVKTDTLTYDTGQTPAESISKSIPETTQKLGVKLTKDELALVNDYKITKDYLETKLQSLPEQYKSMYKNDKEGFLEQLIIRELLYQDAVRKGFAKNLDYITDAEQRKDEAINRYITDFTNKIQVSDQEIQAFYNANINQMRGMTLNQVKDDIKNYLAQQKQGELFPQLINELKAKATIIKNEDWLKAVRALKPEDPLDKALKNGMPTVLDLGSATCVPCKMMKPIFEELEKEYRGKANIILLDIYEHPDLSSKYRVRLIPTQIFFDKNGNQYWRHEGYLAKEEIVKKLKELGVE